MREIKFRAWDKDLKKMRHIERIEFDWYGQIWKIFVRENDNEVGCWLFLHEVELMQFTGLLDKNGKEIWESDLLMHTSRNGRKPIEVFWDDGGWWGRYTGKHFVFRLGQYECLETEVIGNIYEHSFLLKEKNENKG